MTKKNILAGWAKTGKIVPLAQSYNMVRRTKFTLATHNQIRDIYERMYGTELDSKKKNISAIETSNAAEWEFHHELAKGDNITLDI
ncbi:hypothetical protein GQ44DRAFT_776650 [Phaeosphaeriaceae sp. PMI808]|nr:hypothetical protein GQ44DRAFT_776650 [Phaeosphaeriaceae sp. PMI808]